MGEAVRTSGVAGTFTATFAQVPVGTPTVTLFADPARTQIAVPTAPLLATGNPTSWLAAYPATLPAGRYYATFTAVYSAGQPASVDSNDTLLLQAAEVTVVEGLVTLEQVKKHLGLDGLDQHDDELALLLEAATPVIEEMAGPVLPREVTEIVTGLILTEYPVLSLQSVTRDGVPLTGYSVQTPSAGVLAGPRLRGDTVTYVAGLPAVPPDVKRAALRWIAWSWRRDHGGSDTYMPGGDDATIPGPGVRGIEAELRHILSARLRGPRVA